MIATKCDIANIVTSTGRKNWEFDEDMDHRTAVHYAARNGNLEMVKVLIGKKITCLKKIQLVQEILPVVQDL